MAVLKRGITILNEIRISFATRRLASTVASIAAGGGRILLVDDHDDTNHVMKLLLEQKGYHVVTADSVTSAIEFASRQPFDLLISDIGLPDGSGIDPMQHLRMSSKN